MELANYRLKSVNARGLELRKNLAELHRVLDAVKNAKRSPGSLQSKADGADNGGGGKSDAKDLAPPGGAAAVAAPAAGDKKPVEKVQAIAPNGGGGGGVANSNGGDGLASLFRAFGHESAASSQSNIVDTLVGLEHVPSMKALTPAKKVSQGRSGGKH